MSLSRGIFVVAGYGTGSGTGSGSAIAFLKLGYKVAIIARRAEAIEQGVKEINASGGDAAGFPLKDYTPASIVAAFDAINKQWPNETIRVALFNAGHAVWKPFLEVTAEEWQESVETNILAPAAFARAVISVFNDHDLSPEGASGTLLITGATSSIRGNKTTSSFSAGKHGLRALSQSLAKEFGKDNIHITHAIIDGPIKTGRNQERFPDKLNDPDFFLTPEGIAEAYVYLAHQPRATWTWELDLRSAHEPW